MRHRSKGTSERAPVGMFDGPEGSPMHPETEHRSAATTCTSELSLPIGRDRSKTTRPKRVPRSASLLPGRLLGTPPCFQVVSFRASRAARSAKNQAVNSRPLPADLLQAPRPSSHSKPRIYTIIPQGPCPFLARSLGTAAKRRYQKPGKENGPRGSLMQLLKVGHDSRPQES